MGRKQEVMGLEWKNHSCLAPASVIAGTHAKDGGIHTCVLLPLSCDPTQHFHKSFF